MKRNPITVFEKSTTFILNLLYIYNIDIIVVGARKRAYYRRGEEMKIVMICFVLLLTATSVQAEQVVKTVCPKTEILSVLTEQDKQELLRELPRSIIPKLYGKNPKYLDYQAEVIMPMQNLQGVEKSYYYMAIQNCGRDIANRSWFVRIRFPKMQNAYSFSEIFLAKKQNNEWIVWYQYH